MGDKCGRQVGDKCKLSPKNPEWETSVGNKSRNPSLNFTYGVETLILYQSLKIPNLSHYKMMVLNLQGITENDNMILLQNEDGFLS